jgi:DNA-binding MarR family transcriptional regulator
MTPSKTATVAIDEPPALLRANLGWLCSKVLMAYRDAAEPAVEDIAGGMRGYLVLAAAASGCANNQLEVARRLGVDRSVMVGLLDSLEQAGLVTRRPNPTDRRERAIALTPAGTKRLTEIRARLEQASDQVLAPLSAEQRDGLLAALHTVVANIGNADPQAVVPCGE